MTLEPINPILKHLNEPIPEKLWHYTTIHGFHGIITTKTIFATEIHFLNDKEELIHAHKIADQIADETPERGSDTLMPKKVLKQWIKIIFDTGLFHQRTLQVFVTSFSAAEDQLSQWRAYSRGSSGVSVAFDLSALRPPVGADSFISFAPCVYKPNDKRALLTYALSHLTEPFRRSTASPGIKSIIERASDSNEDAVTEEFLTLLTPSMTKSANDLLRIVALMKDESFQEEQEWRFVVPVDMKKRGRLSFRSANTTLIPYFPFNFGPKADTPVPLVDVVLGPGSDENSIRAAQCFLEGESVSVTPRLSRVPYRPW